MAKRMGFRRCDTPAETLQRLQKVFTILSENGIKLNKDKCQFMVMSIQYLGLKIDQEGIRKTPKKIQTIMKAKRSLVALFIRIDKSLQQVHSKFSNLNRSSE